MFLKHRLLVPLTTLMLCMILTGCSFQSSQPVTAVSQSKVDTSQNSSSLFLEGDQIFSQADLMLRSAKSSVLLEMYELGSPSELQLLEDDGDKGIPVLVLLDAQEPQSKRSVAELKAHHVSVLVARDPLIGGRGIQHAKLLVIDDSQLLIGGMNWGKGSYKNADADVFLKGSAAQEAQAIFEKDWSSIGGSIPAGVVKETNMGQSIFSGQTLLSKLLVTLDSSSFIQASLFELSNRSLLDKLKACAKAGANVQVVLDSQLESAQNRSVVDSLRAAGVQVRMYPKGQVLHAKMLIADHTLVIGSANWSFSAFSSSGTFNHELDLFTSDQVLLSHAKSTFQEFWNSSQ
ncbi:hypothetical protein Desaci_4751 (plasmid) [Desulfosporosinus acidiphilus SJ4]|uniref:phospholipase D n=1 Tax=Desulfosporosinus acidiphilus (strain DSM 22704 / JCM 16185 / SJ4) TaxID=646529 RepID=I4DCQ3_DESAJ|nr:phosphatidylserine/phosphatidylglycerophosphate/cardiolipin synthase family protein [Desulfosporosinus acidiphilus]AFM43577.1 hypothetical protein Desaci_4751 [Desulfosporosinus acidiphilus SJ4]